MLIMINRYNLNEQAKVCSGQKCMHVYGDAAKIINVIAIVTAIAIGGILINKALQ
tara:strand:+ start:3367 stop:3531 length:165 start_codon:yes stop_codon:yes gene_type:complete